ncbi:hypothetical protein Bpfe_018927 [Biomphalaria pfeifferi]|uniref:Uncharacterized protein n=1 Tax=Biomphalaria pfeifferi TaxID=112525 RepID=A0AAD8BCH0_BIOPF|nr:hypothetical protein Bpfe_018927 [Biomphalaria pfeifferi]
MSERSPGFVLFESCAFGPVTVCPLRGQMNHLRYRRQLNIEAVPIGLKELRAGHHAVIVQESEQKIYKATSNISQKEKQRDATSEALSLISIYTANCFPNS